MTGIPGRSFPHLVFRAEGTTGLYPLGEDGNGLQDDFWFYIRYVGGGPKAIVVIAYCGVASDVNLGFPFGEEIEAQDDIMDQARQILQRNRAVLFLYKADEVIFFVDSRHGSVGNSKDCFAGFWDDFPSSADLWTVSPIYERDAPLSTKPSKV